MIVKYFFIICLVGSFLHVSADENQKDQKDQKNLKEKLLYMNVDSYNKRMQKEYKIDEKKPKMKIYRHKDGTIDTFKTFQEANQ